MLCEHCGKPILFGVDPSEGNGPMTRSLRLMLTCPEPECQKCADYSRAPVSRYRKVTDRAELVVQGADR